MDQTPPGKSFEHDVAELLALTGFRLEAQARTDGFQPDIVARRGTSPFEETYLVEVKDHVDRVGNDAVLKLSGAVNGLRRTYPSLRGLLISRSGFTRDAEEAASAQHDIRIATLEEILDSLIDFSPYLQRYVHAYESTSIQRIFVDPAITQPTSEHAAGSGSFLDFFTTWLEEGKGGENLLLLGEYGSGKTVAVEHLTYRIAKLILVEKSPQLPVPIIVYLRDFPKAVGDLRYLLTSYLVNELGTNANYTTFRLLLQRGRIVLILDGFDEMAMSVDEVTRDSNFLLLQSLCSDQARVIITGRPEYFPSGTHLKELLSGDRPLDPIAQASLEGFQTLPPTTPIALLPFDDARIRRYLDLWEEYFSGPDFPGARSVLAKIRSIHDLRSLASRPVLLNLIVKTLPALLKREGAVTAALLYDSYTKFWLIREEQKGRRLIPNHIKEAFVYELAWKMLLKGTLAINYRDLPLEILDFFDPKSNRDWEAYDHDIRTCSYLHRDELGNYAFAHRTFMEYFCAARIRDELIAGTSNPMAEVGLPSEVLHFLRDLTDESVLILIQSLIYSYAEEPVFRKNILRFFALIPLVSAVGAYVNCLAYFPAKESGALNRQLRHRIDRLHPGEGADIVGSVLELQNIEVDDRVSKQAKGLLKILDVDSMVIAVYAEYLKGRQSAAELLEARRLPMEFFAEKLYKLEQVREAVASVIPIEALEDAMREAEVELAEQHLRQCESLNCSPRLLRELLGTFEFSPEEALSFARSLRLKSPERLTAAAVFPKKEAVLLGRELGVSAGAATEIFRKSRMRRDEMRGLFRNLRRRPDREDLLGEIQRRASLPKKEFRVHFAIFRAALNQGKSGKRG